MKMGRWSEKGVERIWDEITLMSLVAKMWSRRQCKFSSWKPL